MSAGAMGAAVGRRMYVFELICGPFFPLSKLVETLSSSQNTAFDVHTIVEGRSQETKDRATKASFKLSKSLEDLIDDTSILVSILPPAEAVPFAEKVLNIVSIRPDRGERFTFVDCNAISPTTTREIAQMFASKSMATFVDGSIVGGPPKEGYSPTFYFSGDGDAAERLQESFQSSGIVVKTLSGGIGAASALKMVSSPPRPSSAISGWS